LTIGQACDDACQDHFECDPTVWSGRQGGYPRVPDHLLCMPPAAAGRLPASQPPPAGQNRAPAVQWVACIGAGPSRMTRQAWSDPIPSSGSWPTGICWWDTSPCMAAGRSPRMCCRRSSWSSSASAARCRRVPPPAPGCAASRGTWHSRPWPSSAAESCPSAARCSTVL